jgi:hypothetical protein
LFIYFFVCFLFMAYMTRRAERSGATVVGEVGGGCSLRCSCSDDLPLLLLLVFRAAYM